MGWPHVLGRRAIREKMKKAATLLVLTTFLYLYSDKTFKGMANVEIWKDIHAYMGYYQASNLGQIRRLDSQSWKGRILKQRTAHNGYKRIELCMNNIRKAHPVHRLIAQAFIPNPENKPMINHKNGIRDD